MHDHPLAPPHDDALLEQFLAHFRLERDRNPRTMLARIATAFARLPYENLTKIVKEAELGTAERSKRSPEEVLRDHVQLGGGGTCFSLTATLLNLVRSLGFEAEPLLADRRYGPDTHCGLVVWIDGEPHLIDPGYLITQPIPLGAREEQRVQTAFNEILLTPQPGGEKLDLSTLQQGNQKHRLTFKTAPVDSGQFLQAWEASFDWDMMRYPLLTRVADDRQLYLQGNRLQIRTLSQVNRAEIPPDELVVRIASEFGIDPRLAAAALALLERKGERHGQA